MFSEYKTNNMIIIENLENTESRKRNYLQSHQR